MRTGRRASCTIASMLRWSTPMCSPSRRSRSGSSTASASSRSAVTGVRRRWERSATAARSSTSSSLVRSARPLRARASSSVSSVPRDVGARREVARPQLVRDAGHLEQRFADPAADPRRDRPGQPHQHQPQADDAQPGLRSRPSARPRGTRWCGQPSCPGRVTHRDQHPAAVVVDHGERLAPCGPPYLRVLRVDAGADDLARRRQHPGRGLAAFVGRTSTTSRTSASPTPLDTTIATLRAAWSAAAHRAVLGERPHQQAERDHEGDDDRRRRGQDQP